MQQSPNASVGSLDIGGNGGSEMTMIAWVNPTGPDHDFVAGIWQEDDTNPERQYGLFVDLPLYGGSDQVVGHISRLGGATEGYPYSRDYSASAQRVSPNRWRAIAMTYDGEFIRSFINGAMDARPTYTDSLDNTYSKNPYSYPDGLNTDSEGDFTVGAVLLTSGMGNFFGGKIGGIALFDEALSQQEIMDFVKSKQAKTTPIWDFDFWTTSGGEAVGNGGFRAFATAAGTEVTNTFATNGTAIGNVSGNLMTFSNVTNQLTAVLIDTIGGVLASELDYLSLRLNDAQAADITRFMIRIGEQWYISEQALNMAASGATGANWATAEVKTQTMSLAAGVWRPVTLVPGSTLTSGAATTDAIPDGEVTGLGIWNPGGNTGIRRAADLQAFLK